MKDHPGAPPGAKRSPATGKRDGDENIEASNLRNNHSRIVVVFPPAGWKTAMRRGYAIRKYRGTAKVYAVRLWRVAVVGAIGQEVRT